VAQPGAWQERSVQQPQPIQAEMGQNMWKTCSKCPETEHILFMPWVFFTKNILISLIPLWAWNFDVLQN